MKKNIIFATIIAIIIIICGSVYTYTRFSSENKTDIPKDVETLATMTEFQSSTTAITAESLTATVVMTTAPIQVTTQQTSKPVAPKPKPTTLPTETPTTEPPVTTDPPIIELPETTEPEIEITTPTEPEIEQETTEPPKSNLVLLGRFKLTAYCPGRCCNGQWAGQTSTGATLVEGRTIAVDPKVIPYGSRVVINGHTYVAEDCGGGIKGKRIDVFFATHSAANRFGVQYADVYLKTEAK